MKLITPQPTFGVLTLAIPGPDRKRTTALYQFRVTYRNPTPGEPGCVMTWEATGGRLSYQVALERTDGGGYLWHCSCADAVYRVEDNPAHMCKHVRALAEFVPVLPAAVRPVPVRAPRAEQTAAETPVVAEEPSTPAEEPVALTAAA